MPTYEMQGAAGSVAEPAVDGGGAQVTYSLHRPSMTAQYHLPPLSAPPGGRAQQVRSSYEPFRLDCSQTRDACMVGVRSKIKENMNKGNSSDVLYTPRMQYTPRYDQTYSPAQMWRTVPPANLEWRPTAGAGAEGP